MNTTLFKQHPQYSCVYSPVKSWRFGRSLVRSAVKIADTVAAKLDAISSNQLQQINRPVETINLHDGLWTIDY